MKFSDIPLKFQIPFANSAESGYIRAIPQASQIGVTNGAASLTDGFPPLTFLPVGSGGVPPFGQDFNGILNEITQWIQWQNAGGLVTYDATFSTAIGGYPKNALLSGTALGVIWFNTIDNNTANPDSAGAGWLNVPTALDLLTKKFTYYTAAGSANAITITTIPAVTSYTAGLSFSVKITTTNTGAATLNVDGVGAVAITRADLSPTQAGDLRSGAIVGFSYDGTRFQIVGLLTSQLPSANEVVFTTTGTTNWTVPVGVYVIKKVRGWSAGGGGGGYFECVNLQVTPGQVIAVTIGAGGTGGTNAPTAGTAGGSTSFGSFASATGGGAGFGGAGAIQNTNFGPGGIATGGNLNLTGAAGGFGYGSSSSVLLGGTGGGAAFGSGIPAPNQTAGNGGTFPGGGGNGAAGTNPGGVGANGLIIIEY